MTNAKRKDRIISVRLSSDEYEQLRRNFGTRANISEITRRGIHEIGNGHSRMAEMEADVKRVLAEVSQLCGQVERLTEIMLSRPPGEDSESSSIVQQAAAAE